MIKVAINGFGRIGRTAARIIFERYEQKIDLVAINDLTDNPTLTHLLKYDSNYGQFPKEVISNEDEIIVAGKNIKAFAEKDPLKLPWQELGIDVVLECTGYFTEPELARSHIKAGAKKVVISAPAKGGCPTFIIGVNEDRISSEEIISNASCTTNSITPVIDIMHRQFGVQKAMMTTVHSYTADQNLHDAPHKDLRRARAAANNIVPTTTGAAKTTTQVITELNGLFDGLSIRVPTSVVSISDTTMLLKSKTTVEQINAAFTKASEQPRYKNVVAVTDKPLVSRDFIGNPYSTIVDLSLTKVVDGDLAKVVAWYDNEYGYSCRLVEIAIIAAGK